MTLEEWCIKYGKELLYNDTEEYNLAFTPSIFNISQRVMRVHKGGNLLHMREAFSIETYLLLASISIRKSHEYKIMKCLEILLNYDKKLLKNLLKYLYKNYIVDLLITQLDYKNN